jgi:hypothetical protein
MIIHAIGEGVVKEDLLDFCRADSICVLRVKNVTDEQVHDAISIAIELEKARTAYDYKFQSKNGTVYCTELVDTAYNNLLKDSYEVKYGNNILLPDGIYKSTVLEIIIEFKH